MYNNAVLVSHEGDNFELLEHWEPVTDVDVQTPREVYEELIKDGYAVDYIRVPVTDEKAPKERDCDTLVKRCVRACVRAPGGPTPVPPRAPAEPLLLPRPLAPLLKPAKVPFPSRGLCPGLQLPDGPRAHDHRHDHRVPAAAAPAEGQRATSSPGLGPAAAARQRHVAAV